MSGAVEDYEDYSAVPSLTGYRASPGRSLATSEIPEHLRYKPYTVPNQYAGTAPRYLQPQTPKGTPSAEQNKFQPTQFGDKRAFNSVAPRYLNPRAAPNPVSQVPKFAPTEIQAHEDMKRRLGHSGVSSRHLDTINEHAARGTENSPRRQIEREKEKNKRILGWRANSLEIRLTFDELRKRNKKYAGQAGAIDYVDARPSPKMAAKTSMIKEYVQGGAVPYRPDNYESPQRRVQSEDGRWVPGGGSGGGIWKHRPNSPKRSATLRENDIIAAWRHDAKDKVVSTKNIPRVATLSSAESYRRWETDHSTTGSTNMSPAVSRNGYGNSPVRPAYSPQRRVASPQPQSVNQSRTNSPIVKRTNSPQRSNAAGSRTNSPTPQGGRTGSPRPHFR